MQPNRSKPSDSLTAFEKYQELNTRQVAKLIGVTTTKSVWIYVQKGKLPEPRYLASKRPVWRLGEVLDHTHSKMWEINEKNKSIDFQQPSSSLNEVKRNSIALLRSRLGLK